MRFIQRQIIRIALTITIVIATSQLIGQVGYPFMTPTIDSISHSTLEYIQIKNLLLRQQEQIIKETQQLESTLAALNQEHADILIERKTIESELTAINRHLDSLKPKRPDGPRPKVNIIDILANRLTFSGAYGLNMNQLALSNWAAGGENSFTGKAFAEFKLVYHTKTLEQTLGSSFAFGLSRFADKRIEKSDDKIDLTYSLSRNTKDRWKVTLVSTFNTQFANGYKYPNDSTVISTFFAPAYLTLSGGYTYKTKDENFQIYASPLAGKITFVLDQDLADAGCFGVKKGYYDQDGNWIPGEHLAPSLGVNVIINYKQSIGKNITYTTLLNAFYNYAERRDDNRLRLDVNWENTINFVITKYISTILFVHLKYDHNTTFPVYETINGVETVVDNVPKLQFKESLGIAFVHKF